MARVKHRSDDHLLVGYRPRSGQPERYWRCPDQDTFERFDELDRLCKRQGTETPDPVAQFGEVPKPAAARAVKKAEAARAAAARRAEREAAARRGTYTAAEWVGDPDGGAPGPFFTFHHRSMGADRKVTYRTALALHGAGFKDKPMDKVTKADAQRAVADMVVCPNCLERAGRLGRRDLVAAKHSKLLASNPPFDGACIDTDGDSTHWGSLQHSSIRSTVNQFSALWTTAMDLDDTDDPRAAKVDRNPFRRLAVPKFADRPDNDDVSQALSHAQLDSWARAHPEALEALPWVATYGLLRRSETMGMSRVNITWPTLPEHGGRAALRITHVYILEGAKTTLRPWGKTEGSFWKIELPALATEKLRDHMNRFRSQPDPEHCPACRAGTGEHLDPSPNPHRGCDFADTAPVWVDPATGERLKPDAYTSRIAPEAADLAGLTPEHVGFKVTPKAQRMTGATLLLEAGVPIEEVTRMGRWTESSTPLKHYHRTRDQHRGQLLEQFDDEARAQLGLAVRDDAHLTQRLVFSERNLERAEADVELLRRALEAVGVDPDTVVASGGPDRVSRTKRTSAFDDVDAVLAAIASAPTRTRVLAAIGLSAARKNYDRLERFALEHGVELPGKWGRKSA